MRERLDVMNLTQMVEGPPTKGFIDGSGRVLKEPCVLLAVIDAPADKRQYLDDLGVNMTWAEYDSESERWDRCLMSEGVADLLEDLQAAGDFPYHFEAGPSQGELAWLRAKEQGVIERPELSLWMYLVAAPAGALDALSDGANRSKAKSTDEGDD